MRELLITEDDVKYAYIDNCLEIKMITFSHETYTICRDEIVKFKSDGNMYTNKNGTLVSDNYDRILVPTEKGLVVVEGYISNSNKMHLID